MGEMISISRRTERSVESSDAIHVLSVLCLLFLPDSVDLISRNLGIVRGFERGKSHRLSQECVVIVLVDHHGIALSCWF